jgi:shikimate dehydrogenase
MNRRAGTFALIGDPVAHSASPRLFAAIARELGLALVYRAERVPAGDLASFLDRVRSGTYQGLSVTLPHKEAVFRMADSATAAARATGAANTLAVRSGGTLEADNTDVAGLLRALTEHGVKLAGASVLVLGAGGAARAAVQASREQGARFLAVANRTPERARVLVEALGGRAVALERSALQPLLDGADVLVQASAAGLSRPEETPLPAGCVLHRNLTVLDMVYQPLETALLRAARNAGARTVDGLWMLVHQGLEQLRIWTGAEAPSALPAKLHAELAGGLR